MSKDDFLKDNIRKQYLNNYIYKTLKNQILRSKSGKNTNHNIYLSYLSFVVNALQNRSIALRQIFKLRTSNRLSANKDNDDIQLSYKQKLIVNYFYQLANSQFQLNHSKTNNNQESFKLIHIIEFDQLLEQSLIIFKYCLNSKQMFLEKISKDYINVEEIIKVVSNIQKIRNDLQKKLIILLKQNSKNLQLLDLCEGFQDCLTISTPFTKFISCSRKQDNKSNNNKAFSNKNDIAAIFITLLDEVGKIKKVSSNFMQVVNGFQSKSNQDLLNKNIKCIMSDEISQVHDYILLDSLKRQEFNQQIQDRNTLVGKNSSGWAVAYNIKIQMCMIGNYDLGSCAQIKRILTNDMYIQTSNTKKGLKIFLIDEVLAHQLFRQQSQQNKLSQIQIKNIFLSRLSPMLTALIEKGSNYNNSLETIVIQPQNLSKLNSSSVAIVDIFSNQLISQLLQHQLCVIKFIPQIINNRQIEFVQIQVQSVRQVIDFASKKEAINNLIVQIQQYIDITKLNTNFSQALTQFNSSTKSSGFMQDGFSLKKNSIMNSNKTSNISTKYNQSKIKYQNQETNILEESFSSEESENLNDHQLKQHEKESFKSEIILKQKLENEMNEKADLEMHDKTKLEMHDKTNLEMYDKTNLNMYDKTQLDININSFKRLNEKSQQEIIKEQQSKTYLSDSIIEKLSSTTFYPQPMMQDKTSFFSDEKIVEKSRFQVQNTIKNKEEYLNIENNKMNNTINIDTLPISPISNKPLLQIQSNRKISTRSLNPNSRMEQQMSYESFSEEIQKEGQQNQQLKILEENQPNVKSSITSQKSSSRALVMKVIKQKSKSSGLKIINWIGIISILIIGLLNLASYTILTIDTSKEKINFQNIFWCFSTKRYLSYAIGVKDFFSSLQLGYYYFPNSLYQYAFIKQIFAMKIFIYYGLKNSTLLMLEGDPNEIYVYEKAMEYETQQYWINSIEQKVVDSSTQSLYFRIIEWNTNAYFMLNNTDTNNLNFEMAFSNYYNMLDGFEQIYEKNRDNFNNNINQSKLITLSQVLIISIVTGVLSFMVIPIYIINQNSRQQILSLFATISLDHIIQMMNSISFYLDKLNNFNIKQVGVSGSKKTNSSQRLPQTMQQQTKVQQQMLENINNFNKYNNKKSRLEMKKKNIANTTFLPKLKQNLIPGLILSLICSIFNPISAFYIYNQHVEAFQYSLEFLSKLIILIMLIINFPFEKASMDYFLDNLSQLLTLKQQYIYLRLNDPDSERLIQFKERMIENRGKSQQYYNNFVKSFSVFEDQNLYQKERYDSFLLPIIKANICQTIQNTNMDYRQISFNTTICNGLLDGILQQGLFVGCKQALSLLDTFYSLTLLIDATKFEQQFIQTQQEINISSEYTFLTYLAFTSEILHFFFVDRYNDYFDYTHNLSIYFLLVQIFLLIVILFFGWNQFYSMLTQLLFQTKQLLDIINIEILLDNSYIMSFIKQNL